MQTTYVTATTSEVKKLAFKYNSYHFLLGEGLVLCRKVWRVFKKMSLVRSIIQEKRRKDLQMY